MITLIQSEQRFLASSSSQMTIFFTFSLKLKSLREFKTI